MRCWCSLYDYDGDCDYNYKCNGLREGKNPLYFIVCTITYQKSTYQ